MPNTHLDLTSMVRNPNAPTFGDYIGRPAQSVADGIVQYASSKQLTPVQLLTSARDLHESATKLSPKSKREGGWGLCTFNPLRTSTISWNLGTEISFGQDPVKSSAVPEVYWLQYAKALDGEITVAGELKQSGKGYITRLAEAILGHYGDLSMDDVATLGGRITWESIIADPIEAFRVLAAEAGDESDMTCTIKLRSARDAFKGDIARQIVQLGRPSAGGFTPKTQSRHGRSIIKL